MASLVSIWNLALAHIGNRASLSSASAPYTSVEGERCAQFWPLARQFAIVKCKPSWARRRDIAALVDLGDYQPSEWLYAYAPPGDALEIIGVYDPEGVKDEKRKGSAYESASDGSGVIYTNVEQAWLRYLVDVEDTSLFHPAFTMGVSLLLASYLAGPIIKGMEGMKVAEAHEKKAIAYLSLSETHDTNQQQRSDVFRDGNQAPTWINARGFGDTIFSDARVIYEE